MFVLSLIISVLGALIVFGTLFAMKRKLAALAGGKTDVLAVELDAANTALDDLVKRSGNVASKAQLESVTKQIEDVLATIAKEREALKETESKLDNAQKSVETKETAQQEMKTAKEEDEAKLQDILARYANNQQESISLEQKLAESLKSLDAFVDESSLTADQKAVVQEVQNVLTSAGSRLRDLLMEHEATNQRLLALQTQHLELEEEYTKLVEQQLGE